MKENQLNRVFYLNMNREYDDIFLSLRFFKLKPFASFKFGEPIGLEHTTERFGERLYLGIINKLKNNQDVPYMISTVYHGYSSSLYLKLKAVGGKTEIPYITILAESMTLCRF
ncbi:hypothetical protein BDF21DRAFT_426366 [Thamnidium elegans]|nr:hypothetical protein BDF21DRAFT_426365 [Thamnidium elegans]KAI8067313.1 hypothetical protein BDF21DRAFT_426366 [Thamnidium elegans]